MTPLATQGTSFQKYGRPDTRAVMNCISFDIENISGPHGSNPSDLLLPLPVTPIGMPFQEYV
jgi:hypothetical protein